MAIYMSNILIKGSFSLQVHCYAHGATLLFLVLGWCLVWRKDVSFPNLQATHLDFYPSWLCSGLCLYDCSLTSSWHYKIAAYVQECGGHCHCAWCLVYSWLNGACVFNVTFCMLLYSAFRGSSWEHELLLAALGFYYICLQRPLHNLPGGVFSC